MAIAYVGTGAPSAGSIWFWTGAGPVSASSYTPAVGNTLLSTSQDRGGTGKTIALTSTVGTYTKLATASGTGVTGSAFASINVPNSGQVLTADSAPTGDFFDSMAWEFSGVGSVSATISTASSSNTTAGAIAGQAVVVPVGSLLYAVFVDTSEAIGQSPILNTGTGVYDNGFDTIGVTYSGAGSSITPSATPRAATATNYLVHQFLLLPPGSSGGLLLTGAG